MPQSTLEGKPLSATASEKFNSPEEELAYLRERVKNKERELNADNSRFEKARIAKREVQEYQAVPVKEVLHDTYAFTENEVSRFALNLDPEPHDTQIDELLRMVSEKGIKNALRVAAKMKSAHLDDDLHRALVQYIAEGLPAKDIKPNTELWRALHMVLYEVSLPTHGADDKENQQQQDLEKLLASMEQFYLGMLSVTSKSWWGVTENVFTVEVASRIGSEEAVFYVSLPRSKKELFEKHLISIFPNAKLAECRNDYNVFFMGGAHTGAYAALEKHAVFPLKPYKEFTHDPLNVILSAFSKLKKHREGAAIQFVIGDHGKYYNKRFKKIVDNVRKGYTEKRAVRRGKSAFNEVLDDIAQTVLPAFFPKENSEGMRHIDQTTMDEMNKKIQSRIVPVNVRIVASSEHEPRSAEIIDNIASTFNQFESGLGNRIYFRSLHGGALHDLFRAFTYRRFVSSRALPLSVQELTSMYHLTASGVKTSRELKQSRAKQIAAPIEVGGSNDEDADEDAAPNGSSVGGVPATSTNATPKTSADGGIVLGKNNFGGSQTLVHYKPKDRMRHFYEIGQTGTGKTTLMVNMVIQDIKNGDGCCYIDPHGSDIEDILANVPPERYDDVIYFDPGNMTRPMGLNMMEYNPEYPEQKTFVVNEIFQIFEKLFGDVPESLGPMFQQYFRNGAMLVLEGMPPGTATMADIPRVLANAQFRRECKKNSKNPIVNQFWEEIAEKAGGEASLENVVPYITSKTDIFLGNDLMRNIVAQPKSAFNFRQIMDEKKIMLINLSKGRIGDLNSELLGLIFVGKFLQAALSRVDAPADQRPPFYLYIDEFQNFTTPSIATILSEARKYQLSLNIAHQFIKQLDEKIRDAVFGNVGTKCVFRVGIEDAEFLEKQFQPEFTQKDIVGLDNYNAYLALLVDGRPVKPFNFETLVPAKGNPEQIQRLKQASFEKYGRPLEEVDKEIMDRYMPPKPDPAAAPDPFAGGFPQF